MPRRIDIELTSAQSDGSWTWRAAGAKSPKGVVAGSVLGSWAPNVGDVVRAEAETSIEGTEILSVIPPRATKTTVEKIEWIGAGRYVDGVVANVSKRALEGDDRPRREGGDRPNRGPRPERGQRPDRPAGERGPRPDRPAGERGPRPDRPAGERAPRPAGERGPRPDRPVGERTTRPPRPVAPAAPRFKRLRAGRVHRNDFLASLPESQRPIAEQLFRGGVPAVRQAIDAQNAELKAAGQPEVRVDALLKLAEDLNHKVRAADWKDRADGALVDIEELDLRDLRALIAGANDVALDEATREPAAALKAALDRRVDAEHNAWLADIVTSANEGRIVRALKQTSRPVKAGARFPADVGAKLIAQAGASMTADASADRWDAMLEALSFAPMRAMVQPASVPAVPSEALLASVKKYAKNLPHIAALFGINTTPTTAPLRVPAPPAAPAAVVASEPEVAPEPEVVSEQSVVAEPEVIEASAATHEAPAE